MSKDKLTKNPKLIREDEINKYLPKWVLELEKLTGKGKRGSKS